MSVGVVTQHPIHLLAKQVETVHGRPPVNDLATLLAHAMRRPLDGDARRPSIVRLRGHRQAGLARWFQGQGVDVDD
jgi:hypothetical protein